MPMWDATMPAWDGMALLILADVTTCPNLEAFEWRTHQLFNYDKVMENMSSMATATTFDVAGVSARADKALVKNQSNPEGEFCNISPHQILFSNFF